jgi:hypothetical protein
MSADTNMVRAKLHKALDAIGKSNGHACPETTSNHDADLHELYVASEASSYWTKRHDKAKAKAVILAGSDLTKAVDSVIKLQSGTSIIGAAGDLYTMTIDISKPAMRLDATALKSRLQLKHNMTSDEVEKLFDACSKQSAPAKKMKVSSN